MLIHTCEIVPVTNGQSSTGAFTEVEGTAVTGVPCRFFSPVTRIGNREPMPNIGQMVQTDKQLILKPDVSISTKYKVNNIKMRCDASTVDSDTYEVIEVKDRYGGGRKRHISCLLKKIE